MTDTEWVEQLLAAADAKPLHCFVQLSFLRPNGDGIYRAIYDMAADLDISTINMNIADGYRIVNLTLHGRDYPQEEI